MLIFKLEKNNHCYSASLITNQSNFMAQITLIYHIYTYGQKFCMVQFCIAIHENLHSTHGKKSNLR